MTLSTSAKEEASRLHKSVAFQEVLAYLERGYYDAMMATLPDDQATREAIYHRVQAMKDLQATLRNLAREADKGDHDA